MGVRPYRLELQIEELVLHGFPPWERHRIGDALQGELARLLAEEATPTFALTGDREIGRLAAGAFELAPGMRPEAVGIQVARAVYGGTRDRIIAEEGGRNG